MKQIATAFALSIPLLASAQNLLTNGSFETGLTGWTVTSSASSTIAPASITYGAPGSAFGEVIPVDDNTFNLSPDAAGTSALYFVDDNATQVLSQTFTIAVAGYYAAGVTTYVPFNGSFNLGDATFQVVLANSSPSVEMVSGLAVGVWEDLYSEGYLDAGTYTVSFSFATTGGQSKDIILDRAYVVAVPEPETFALMLAGLAGVGFMARRRQSR